jgi:hypothetical protein
MLPLSYSKAVLTYYQQKLAADELSLHIKQLSSASFKEACLEVRRERFSKKDDLPLRAFFGEGANQDACLLAIKVVDNDKFKPLVYFIKGKTKKPDDKVVELVAWLIDFKDRPYDPGLDYSESLRPTQALVPDKAVDIPNTVPAENQNGPQAFSPEPIKDSSQNVLPKAGKERIKRKRIILAITISIAFGMVAFWIWPRKPTNLQITGHEACMFWADDHYQPVSCAQKIDNTQVIALDSEMIKNVHKITRPDTITLNSIGSVWYVKYRGVMEYYTDSGSHPLDPNLRLKPITPYMIRKYIHPAP